jgi:RNA polymerase sigma factor (sigma-70 family)
MKAPALIPSDETLVADAVAGNRRALDALLRRHQDYIYNLALRLFLHPDDALDATQEVLIKVVTSLRTFGGKSQFRTWLYRIVVNHFLNSPVRQYERLYDRSADVNTLAVADAPEREATEAEVEEVRVLCSTAMLLCLSRDQRLLYIIGEIFGADHALGAELFGLTPGNYRVRLHRAKADLLNYVTGKCGLVNPHQHYTHQVAQVLEARREAVSDEVQLRMQALFRNSPYQVRQELDELFEGLLP